MTERVDFYVLKSSAPKQRWTFACRLTEKAYLRDMRVLVLSNTAADAEVMDEMLWTFNERSFVPHALSRGSFDAATPVHLADLSSIGFESAATGGAGLGNAGLDVGGPSGKSTEGLGKIDLLVNLSDRLPLGLERFARVAEVIDADDERRRLGRERFKVYRDLKVPLETHQLDDTADV